MASLLEGPEKTSEYFEKILGQNEAAFERGPRLIDASPYSGERKDT